jgi:hypothetical protein
MLCARDIRHVAAAQALNHISIQLDWSPFQRFTKSAVAAARHFDQIIFPFVRTNDFDQMANIANTSKITPCYLPQVQELLPCIMLHKRNQTLLHNWTPVAQL